MLKNFQHDSYLLKYTNGITIKTLLGSSSNSDGSFLAHSK